MSSPIALQPELQQCIDLQVHGLSANLIFDEHGLSPYRGLVSVFEPDHADSLDPLPACGSTFEVTNSSYWSGKLADPDGYVDGGMYEYQYGLWTDDDVGDRGLSAKFRPGFPEATHVDTGDLIGGMPTDCPESLRVQVEATNLTQAEVLELLQALAERIDLNPAYFQADAVHEWSSIYGLETYARVDREAAMDNLVGKGGVLEHIAQFSNGRGRGEYKWDHEDIVGKYEAVALDPESWARLIPDQTLAKRLKCYQPANVRGEERQDDPLYHPKLEAQYWSGYYGSGDDSLAWDGYDRAVDELTETVVNALNWAGLSVQPDDETFVADAYWDVQERARETKVVSNPMPDLEEHEQMTAREELLDPETTRAEWDVLEALTDAGEAHHARLADGSGRSSRTVYRAAERFEFIEVDGGEVRFKDEVIREEISDIVDRFEQVAENTLDAIRRTAERANPLSSGDGEPSPLEKWCNRHGIVPKDTYEGLKLEIGQPVDDVRLRQLLRAGLEAAEGSAILTSEFKDALITWTDLDGNTHRNYKAFVNGEPLGRGAFKTLR